jgi:hypothetical protein
VVVEAAVLEQQQETLALEAAVLEEVAVYQEEMQP